MKLDVIVRSDAPWKSGGDSVQIQEYARWFGDAGIDLREVPFHPAMRLRRGAVVHVFNVDRPFEFLMAARRARGHRLVVSPIHHNAARVRSMRAADSGRGLVSVAGRLLPEPAREWAATAVRAFRGSTSVGERAVAVVRVLALLPVVPSVWRATGRALDRAHAVALLADGEGADLAALTGWRRDNDVLVPNGRPQRLDVATAEPWARRVEGSIVVVGRIEPRKRQLEVARAAVRLGVPVTFIGPRFNEGDAYTAAFDELTAPGSVVRHLGALPRAEALAAMGRSRVLLNASWVEVQSLVDLEAASMGCAVVASAAGHSREWLGDAVHEVASGEPEDLLHTAARLAASDAAPDPVEYDRTWQQAAETLLGLYGVRVPRSELLSV